MAEKSALLFAPVRETLLDLNEAVDRQSWLELECWTGGCIWRSRSLILRLDVAHTLDEVKRLLRGTFYSAIFVDCRHLPGQMEEAERQERELYALLAMLASERDREQRYPFRRLAVLVGDSDRERVDQLIFNLGQKHVGAFLRDRSITSSSTDDDRLAAKDRLIEQLWRFCSAILVDRPRGKKAVCAAGGGISGVYYELGVLKCLHDAFAGFDMRDFDMYFGIGAGAFVTSFVANDFHIDDLLANIGELRPDWPYKLKLGWRNLNVNEIPRRVRGLQRAAWQSIGALARGADLSTTVLLDNYALPFGPMFSNAELEKALRAQFALPRRTNDFRRLARKLFIGATDQDLREHVLFGDTGFDDVPISVAVQASSSIHPFFPSVSIRGRYYSDGAITRTSNLRAAIDKGADLVFVVDPFLPCVSSEAGFNAKHGNLWITHQDIKTLAYTRFAQVSEEILRQHPQVSCYTFLPSNRMRALLAQNPVMAEGFDAIATEAYRSTYRRLALLEYKAAADLESHGIKLDLRPVAQRVEAIERCDRPDASVLLDSN